MSKSIVSLRKWYPFQYHRSSCWLVGFVYCIWLDDLKNSNFYIAGTSCLQCLNDVIVNYADISNDTRLKQLNAYHSYYEIDVIKLCTDVYLKVLVQNEYTVFWGPR